MEARSAIESQTLEVLEDSATFIEYLNALNESLKKYNFPTRETNIYAEPKSLENYHQAVRGMRNEIIPWLEELYFLAKANKYEIKSLDSNHVSKQLERVITTLALLVEDLDYVIKHIQDQDDNKKRCDKSLIIKVEHIRNDIDNILKEHDLASQESSSRGCEAFSRGDPETIDDNGSHTILKKPLADEVSELIEVENKTETESASDPKDVSTNIRPINNETGLPYEIWKKINKNLGLAEFGSLSLTCRFFAWTLKDKRFSYKKIFDQALEGDIESLKFRLYTNTYIIPLNNNCFAVADNSYSSSIGIFEIDKYNEKKFTLKNILNLNGEKPSFWVKISKELLMNIATKNASASIWDWGKNKCVKESFKLDMYTDHLVQSAIAITEDRKLIARCAKNEIGILNLETYQSNKIILKTKDDLLSPDFLLLHTKYKLITNHYHEETLLGWKYHIKIWDMQGNHLHTLLLKNWDKPKLCLISENELAILQDRTIYIFNLDEYEFKQEIELPVNTFYQSIIALSKQSIAIKSRTYLPEKYSQIYLYNVKRGVLVNTLSIPEKHAIVDFSIMPNGEIISSITKLRDPVYYLDGKVSFNMWKFQRNKLEEKPALLPKPNI